MGEVYNSLVSLIDLSKYFPRSQRDAKSYSLTRGLETVLGFAYKCDAHWLVHKMEGISVIKNFFVTSKLVANL